MLCIVLVINLAFLFLLYKELKLTTFDPVYAATIGLPVVLIHYGFMTTISLTTVSAFDSVGAILVIAMLIGPAATAYLISRSIKQMFCWSVSFGVLATIIGYYVAKYFDTSIAGMMATAVGFIFIFVFIVDNIRQKMLKKMIATD